jgi:hypothetical protein
VPVYIHGSYQAWGPHTRYPWPHLIQMIFGQKFSADFLAAKGREIKPGVQTNEAIVLGLRQEVLSLKEEIKSGNQVGKEKRRRLKNQVGKAAEKESKAELIMDSY